MKHEPIWTVAGMSAVAAAIIALLVAFGVNLTEAQTAAVLGFVAVLAPTVVAFITRSKVTPNAKVAEVVREDGVRIAGEASPLPTGMVIDPAINEQE